MTSLTEVYEGGAGGADLRRLYVGVGLFVVGVALTVAGIVFGTSTPAASAVGLSVPYGAREVAGILAGVGLPVTFLGAITVLPRARLRLRAAAGLGVVVSLAGVVAFTAVYPGNWYGMSPDHTLPVTFVYFLGALTTLWCLFVAVANFKARNDPGGTVRLEITKQGRTKVVEVSNDRLRQGLGGIGLLGQTPDGDVETQTNDPGSGPSGVGRAARSAGGGARGPTLSDPGTGSGSDPGGGRAAPSGPDRVSTTPSRSAASGATGSQAAGRTGSHAGGGASTHPAAGSASPDPETTTDAEVMGDDPAPSGDPYCGNCAHFNYVRTDEGLQPYCGLHDDLMDDMDACAQWEP
jgi:hypothetical protein